jgi:hypothetical protein
MLESGTDRQPTRVVSWLKPPTKAPAPTPAHGVFPQNPLKLFLTCATAAGQKEQGRFEVDSGAPAECRKPADFL